MNRPFVESLRIQSYGCIRDATFRLTPLHALIGPNDSGKSTVLRALLTLSYLLGSDSAVKQREVLHQAISTSAGKFSRFEVSTRDARWQVDINRQQGVRWQSFAIQQGASIALEEQGFSMRLGPRPERPAADTANALQGAHLLRLDPNALRAPHPLFPDGQPLRFGDELGTGLSAIYDALIVRDLPAYMRINQELSRFFPSVKSLHLTTPSSGTRGIGVKLVDDTFVPARLMSEGMLYYLAFAVLPYLEPTSLLLVEEPENGLHPSRIAEVIRVLREISRSTQVIIATHSPLVVNELEPNEVTVVTRSPEQGTMATLIQDTPRFEERSKVYALGELWLSYANGEDEGPLLHGGPRP